jgi:hypothetical protein
LPTQRRVVAVITAVAPEVMEQSGDEPLVLTLRSTTGKAWPKRFVLNSSNNQTLIDAFGKETDDWIDCTIEAWQEPVKFGTKWVPGKKLAALNGRGAAQPAIEAQATPATPILQSTPPASTPAFDRRDQINEAVPMPAPTPSANWEAGGGDLDVEIPF